MKTHRIKWLDFAKGFLILDVLIYHSILTGGKIISNIPNDINILNNNSNIITQILGIFTIQSFFAVSGYLYKPANNIHKYILLFYKKFISIMLPGVLFTLVDVSLQNYKLLIKVFHQWYYLFICQYGDTWFLTTLFFIFLIVGLMDLIHLPLYVQMFILVFSFFLVKHFSPLLHNKYVIGHTMGGIPITITNISIYILFFYFGYLFKKFRIAKCLHNKLYNLMICTPSLVIIFIDLIYIHIRMISSFLGVIITFIVFINFNQHNYLFKFLTKYGNYTLIIYLVHWPIVYFLIPRILIYLHLNDSIINNVWLLVPFKIMTAFILSLLICYMTKRICILNFLFYPRKYISKIIIKAKWGRRLLGIN